MTQIRALGGWQRRAAQRALWPHQRSARPQQNLAGPRRALTMDEQIEVQRAMREAAPMRMRGRTAETLASRYGVSIRTIWRYIDTIPTPNGTEFLAPRVKHWAKERGIELTTDDLVTLLLVVSRERAEHR